MLAIVVVMTVAGGPLLMITFGDFYARSAGPLAILSLGQFLGAAIPAGTVLVMTGNERLAMVLINYFLGCCSRRTDCHGGTVRSPRCRDTFRRRHSLTGHTHGILRSPPSGNYTNRLPFAEPHTTVLWKFRKRKVNL